MAKINFPNTSFMNLFQTTIYDKEQNPNYSLDIWDAYIINPEYKDDLTNFEFYTVKAGDTWVALSRKYYDDERLWWVIPLFNNVDNPFVIKQQDILDQNITQIKILSKNIVDNMLFNARRNKIINDNTQQTGK
jgi:hypothetical protein